MRRCLAVLSLALLLVPAPVHADDREAFVTEHLEGLSGKAALEYVTLLADDKMKGRKTAFEGGRLVENWMLEKMSEFGLHPADAGGTYLEPFTYGAANTKAPIGLTVAGKKLTYGQDYFDLTYTGSGKVDAEVVFVGYGIERPDVGWDDYAGMDVKGKIVMAIRGAPAAMSTTFTEERYIGYKSSKAADKGAVGFLLVQNANAATGTIQDRFHRAKLPALWVSGAVADAVVASKQTTLEALKKSRDEGTTGKGFATGVQAQMEVHADYDPHAKGHNALGAIKGRDPDLVHEIILVGAHMDHLGVGPDGQVFNGADDNASGTAVMMHLADVLTANRLRPKRTIIFCGFGAEEQGLFGSRALAERYPFQGEIVAVLNMDMVGQGEPVVRVNGGGCFPRIQSLLSAAIPEAQAKQVEFGPFAGGGSDHWPFFERGVPAFAISTKGKHPNYHTPLDDAAAIEPACLEATANVVGRMLLKLAMHPTSLRDEKAVANFLVREGPRYGFGRFGGEDKLRFEVVDGTTGKGTYLAEAAGGAQARRLLERGLSGAIWHVGARDEAALKWSALSGHAKDEANGLAPVDGTRSIMQARRAWRFGLLPFEHLHGTVDARADALAGARPAVTAVRLVSPWAGLKPDTVTKEAIERLVGPCKRHGLLPDLGPLAPVQRVQARAALGDHPAVAMLSAAQVEAQRGAALEALGPQTLLLVLGDTRVLWPLVGKPDAPPMVFLDGAGDATVEALHAWGVKQPEGWALPGSAQRQAVRAALGGNLVTWLAKAERRGKD